jgi:MurNAc alpha-1-phosphate uridylyltransferase
MLSLAILAGGVASRLMPITKNTPKSLVLINDKPFIHYQLEYLKKQKIKNIVLCVGHFGKMIENEIGDGKKYGLSIKYSYDGKNLLGTGGAIKKALPMLDETFYIMYGDSLLPINYKTIEKKFLASNKPALMTMIKNNNQWDKSNILYNGKYIVEYNKKNPTGKMKYVDYGLGILSKAAFKSFKKQRSFDLGDLYHQLSIEKKLGSYLVKKRFYEIGSHQGLLDTSDFIMKLNKEK